jgi:hypothetical protein
LTPRGSIRALWLAFDSATSALPRDQDMSNTIYRSVAILLAAALAGCGGSNVKVYPVKGKVSFAGKPMVGGGSISFVPTTDQKGKTAAGRIESDGTYVLGTYTATDGSMPGEFKVVINQETVKELPPTPDGTPPSAVSEASVPVKDQIPTTYGSDQTTTLTATVEPKPNEINFDLKRE